MDKTNSVPRLTKDLPSIKNSFYNELLFDSDNFVNKLIEYLYTTDLPSIQNYTQNSDILHLDEKKFETWSAYSTKNNIEELISFLASKNNYPKSYIKGNSKIGFAQTKLCNAFLTDKFSKQQEEISAILDDAKYPVSVLMPLRIHKTSNGNLTFSPDPESGEIVAFSELFSYDLLGKKKRPVIGYCIVDTPKDFDIKNKVGTKLYKALAEYIDILIIDNSICITNLPNEQTISNYMPNSIITTKPIAVTEETAVVSTYLNQTTINSNWQLCFIHTHHSSWQQLVIYRTDKTIQQKIDRVSTKVDLILQQNNKFMISEGKDNFQDIIRDDKIKTAMYLASKKIDELYNNINQQFDAFVYNLHTTPSKEPDFYVNREAETVQAAMEKHHFSDIAHHESFLVIIVYLNDKNQTQFKLVYSPKFDKKLKEQLDKEFNQ